VSRPIREECGCTRTDRAWVTMCAKHKAEHAELHELAARDHAAQQTPATTTNPPRPQP